MEPGDAAVRGEHRVFGEAIVPAASYVQLLISAAEEASGSSGRLATVEGLHFEEALALDVSRPLPVQVVVAAAADGARDVEVLSLGEDQTWRRHARG